MNERKQYWECCQLVLFPYQFLDIGLNLNGVNYTDNSIVNITEIGTGSAALFCNTTQQPCCFSFHGGGWFLPNGNAINNNQSLPYYRTRAQYPGAILLHRNPEGTTTGIFRCDAPVTDGNQSLYVGIYTSSTGESCALSGWLFIFKEIYSTSAKESIFQVFEYTLNSI